MTNRGLISLLLATLLLAVSPARAGQARVAVASNFGEVARLLADEYGRQSGHDIQISTASTGKLYAQIVNGAPFDVLLSADEATPTKLETEGFAVSGTRFTYAVGRLVLWSPRSGVVDDNGAILKSGDFAHLAIANPKTAPYGAAAEQALRRLGVWDRLVARLVYGEHIAQTFQFIHSGNAQLGLVALAQVRTLPPEQRGSQWLVPESLHEPLRQDAVLLKRANGKAAARTFLDTLRSARAKAIIEELGYIAPSATRN